MTVRTFKSFTEVEYSTYLTPTGEPVVFYKGYTTTDRDEIVEFLKTIRGVEEVTDEKDLKIPVPPNRSRERSWASAQEADESPTEIKPLDMLKRAIASSKATPQAAESNSTPNSAK